jgi:hypothetical protein
MSRPIRKVKGAQVPLTAEALLEIARVLRTDSTAVSLVAQVGVPPEERADGLDLSVCHHWLCRLADLQMSELARSFAQ